MKFEWDANKSDANKLKHGIDFKTAKNITLPKNWTVELGACQVAKSKKEEERDGKQHAEDVSGS